MESLKAMLQRVLDEMTKSCKAVGYPVEWDAWRDFNEGAADEAAMDVMGRLQEIINGLGD